MLDVPWLAVELREWFASTRSTLFLSLVLFLTHFIGSALSSPLILPVLFVGSSLTSFNELSERKWIREWVKETQRNRNRRRMKGARKGPDTRFSSVHSHSLHSIPFVWCERRERAHTRSEYRMKKWVNCTHLEPPASGFTVLPPRASNGSASVSCSFQFPPFARIQLTHFRKLGIRNVVNHWSTGEGNVVNWTLGDNGERTQDCAPSFSRLVQLSPYCSVTSLTFSLSYCSTAQFSLFPSLRNQ